MPRNASGTSTLVAGNPVATNTIIESDWANTTMADLNNEMTDSLSRSGKGGMTAQFRAVNGSAPTPAISFSDYPQSGMYAFSENDIRMSVAGVDRFRWLQANALPQTWDSVGNTWLDVGGGGVIWTQMDAVPATAAISTGYVTLGGQTIAMPANPPTGFSVAFADKADDWDATNYLTITGNGNTFSQDSSGTYILDLKGAFAQFSYLEGQWQIVNFGRLSDAYGFDGNDFVQKDKAFGENMIINGGLDIWQRGTSFSSTQAEYTADRWKQTSTGNPVWTFDRQEQDDLSGVTVTPTRYYGELTWSTNPNANLGIQFRLENYFKLSGQTVTLSFDASAVGGDVNMTGKTRSNSNGGGNLDTPAQQRTITAGAWGRYKMTFEVPDLSSLVAGANPYTQVTLTFPEAAGQVKLSAVKLELGETATPFTRAGNTLAGELAMCQRYYSVKWGVGHFTFNQSNDYRYGYSHPVQMRTTPTVSVVAGVTANWGASYPGRTSNNFYSASSSQLTSVTTDVPSVQSDAEL